MLICSSTSSLTSSISVCVISLSSSSSIRPTSNAELFNASTAGGSGDVHWVPSQHDYAINLFDIMGETRATSLHYEVNQLKLQNRYLKEELATLI